MNHHFFCWFHIGSSSILFFYDKIRAAHSLSLFIALPCISSIIPSTCKSVWNAYRMICCFFCRSEHFDGLQFLQLFGALAKSYISHADRNHLSSMVVKIPFKTIRFVTFSALHSIGMSGIGWCASVVVWHTTNLDMQRCTWKVV